MRRIVALLILAPSLAIGSIGCDPTDTREELDRRPAASVDDGSCRTNLAGPSACRPAEGSLATREQGISARAVQVPCQPITLVYDDARAKSVWVSGTFTEPQWAATPDKGAIALTREGAYRWKAKIELKTAGPHQYKLIVDGTRWILDPTNPEVYTDPKGITNSVLGTGACVPCNQITFTYQNAHAKKVLVAGTWNDWAGDVEHGALLLTKQPDGLTWTGSAVIQPGGRHMYKLVVDGSWILDPANPLTDALGGSDNSAIDVCLVPAGEAQCGDLTKLDWRDTLMYFVLIDRFHDSDGKNQPVDAAHVACLGTDKSCAQYQGGDLPGVVDKLSYLQALGVSAIWLSSPADNRDLSGEAVNPATDSHLYTAYHGYWPRPANIDYTKPDAPSPLPQVEPRFGTTTDLKALVDAAHQTQSVNGHNMLVLFDYVMKHVDIESALYKAHPDWFARDDSGNFRLCGPENLWDDPYWGTRCAFTKYLPVFDFEKEAPRKWSIDDAMWWQQEFGLDGYRLDAIKHVPLTWLTELRARVQQEIPTPGAGRFYMVGETYTWEDRVTLKKFINPKTMLDGQFDFPFRLQVCKALFTKQQGLADLAYWLNGNDSYYGEGALMSTWLGNHDIPRAIHFASGQITNCMEGSHAANMWSPSTFAQPTATEPYERLALAFAVLLTNPGVPLIYYGDEIGIAGGGDPDNRRMMPWDETELLPAQLTLRQTVKKLAEIRGAHRAITRGKRTTLSSSADTWVYAMGDCSEKIENVIVALNRADKPNEVQIPAGKYTELLTGLAHSGGPVSLPARSFLILAD